MPSRARKSVGGGVPNESDAAAQQQQQPQPNSGDAQTSHGAATSSSSTSATNKGKNTPGPKQKQQRSKMGKPNVQLFAFDAEPEQAGESTGGRPKRKLKAIARFASSSFPNKAAHCKIGEGFSCPRCSAVCSYDSRRCEECQLECYYEAGIGVVVLKERRVSVDHQRRVSVDTERRVSVDPDKQHDKQVSQQENGVARGTQNNAVPPTTTKQAGKSTASLTMQKVIMQRNKKRQSYPQAKIMDSKMNGTEGNKKKHSSIPQLVKTADSIHPTDENETHISAQAAAGLPDGWVFRRIPRSNGGRKDPYWYSPKKKFKFRSKPDAQRFIESLGKTNGDEAAAIFLFKKCFGRSSSSRRSSAGAGSRAAHGKDNVKEGDRPESGNQLEATMPEFSALEHAFLKMTSQHKGTSKDPERTGVEEKEASTVSSVAAMANRDGDSTSLPIREGPPSADRALASSPLRVRVQLYENELQPNEGGCSTEISNRKMSPQDFANMQEKLEATTDSNSSLANQVYTLQNTNNEVTSLLHDKEAALREADATIATLMQEANSRQISDEVSELRNSKKAGKDRVCSIETEQLAVQDLKRQLGDAENNIIQLTQRNSTINELNEKLQSNLTDTTSQKEKQAAELKGSSKSLQNATEEKNDLAQQLSDLQTKHESTLSTSAKAVSELRETIANLEATIQKTKNSISTVSAERDELAKKAGTATAGLSSMQEEVSNSSAKLKKLQSEVSNISAQRNTAEERANELLSETERTNETMAAMQSEKDELMMKFDRVNATLGTLKLENEVRLNKSETACTENQKEIDSLKQQASKRMSQVYELTDQLSTALTAKTELSKSLESTTADLSNMRDEAASQTATISLLESSVASLTAQLDAANSTASQPSSMEGNKVELTRLVTEKAEAVAKSKSLGDTIDELQGQIYELADQLSTASTEKSELEAKLKSATTDLLKMRDEAASQTTKMSLLESSVSSLTAQRDMANLPTSQPSSVEKGNTEPNRLETEKAEAVAKSKSLENTVDELQGQIERLSAELNASKTVSNKLKSQAEALESRNKECLNELERIINKKERVSPDSESKYKDTIHKLEESINQQNEEMQALNEAVSTSDAQTADLIAQVSTLTTERDEWKTKVEEAMKEVSQLRSTVDSLNTKCGTVEERARGQPSDVVAHPEKSPFRTINSEKAALVINVSECISRLDSEVEDARLKIERMKSKLVKIQKRSNQNGANGINTFHLKLNEVLSRAEKLEKRLAEEDTDLSKLISDAEHLEAHMKKTLQKFKDKYLVTTKDCKAKLKQKHKKILALKTDIANIKKNMQEDRSLSSDDDKDQSSSVTLAGKTGLCPKKISKKLHRAQKKLPKQGAEAFHHKDGHGSLGGDALQHDEDDSTDVQLFAFDVTQEEYNWGRPKRKLKAITHFSSMSFDSKAAHCKIGEGFTCPRCSAVCSYDVKECEECHLKCYYEAGIGVVVLKERNFCLSTARKTKSFGEVEAHFNASEPHKSKKTSHKRERVQAGLKSDSTMEQGGATAKKQGPPSWAWTKIEHVQLVGKEYPRELPRVIDFIEAQCKKQEEHLEAAQGEWKERCKDEAKAEAKALEEERLLYKRGIRERSRMADQERLEKLRYTEKADEMMMRYKHKGGDPGRNKEDIEATKLCSRQIVFSDHCYTHLGENAGACMGDDCQFCKYNSVYRQQVLLDNEINECKLSAPSTDSPLIQKSTKLLNPGARLIDDDYFLQINDGKTEEDPQKAEVDKLKKLKNTKHRLEFIKRYNAGYVTNAWARKDTWNRKSS